MTEYFKFMVDSDIKLIRYNVHSVDRNMELHLPTEVWALIVSYIHNIRDVMNFELISTYYQHVSYQYTESLTSILFPDIDEYCLSIQDDEKSIDSKQFRKQEINYRWYEYITKHKNIKYTNVYFYNKDISEIFEKLPHLNGCIICNYQPLSLMVNSIILNKKSMNECNIILNSMDVVLDTMQIRRDEIFNINSLYYDDTKKLCQKYRINKLKFQYILSFDEFKNLPDTIQCVTFINCKNQHMYDSDSLQILKYTHISQKYNELRPNINISWI